MPRPKESIIYCELGRRIRSRRHDLEISQEDLAHQIGLSRSSLVNIENGRHRVHLATLYNISSALRCSLNDLIPPLQAIDHDLPPGFLEKIHPSERGEIAQALSQANRGKR